MFSPFNMTRLVAQKVSYSAQYDILASDVVLSRFFKKMAYFNVKCLFLYTMKINKYEIKIFIEELCSQPLTYMKLQNIKSYDDVC